MTTPTFKELMDDAELRAHFITDTGITDEDLVRIVKKNFNFRPGNIIKELDLLRPIY